jgi:hypothetical protein
VSVDAYGVRARVRLHAPLADLTPKLSTSAGTLESTGPHTCVLTTGAPSVEALAAWMAMLGVDFEILEPPGTAATLTALAGRVRRAARASCA